VIKILATTFAFGTAAGDLLSARRSRQPFALYRVGVGGRSIVRFG
jgi:hypothetical protein